MQISKKLKDIYQLHDISKKRIKEIKKQIHLNNLKKKKELRKKRLLKLHTLPEPILPKKIIRPITKKEGLELVEAFKSKGMSPQWIKDTMLVCWKLESSKDLKRWQFEHIWKMLNSVKSVDEYKKLLVEIDIC